MQYAVLPGSDLAVSRIALGTWLFGGRRWGIVDERESVRTIQSAIDSGVTFFDTADAYGIGHAETLLGRALRGRRANAVIATKVGVVWRDDGTRVMDLSPSHIRRALLESMKRLQTDVIDLYQLHEMDPATPIAETGLALRALRESGAIRHVGVSNFDTPTLTALREIVPVLTTQSEYSLVRRSIEEELVPYCRANGIAMLAYSPLCRGLLSGKFTGVSVFAETDNRHYDEEFQGAAFATNLRRVSRLATLAAETGCSVAALSIRWVLEAPFVSAVISGARTAAQLEENLRALDTPMSPDVWARVSGLFPA